MSEPVTVSMPAEATPATVADPLLPEKTEEPEAKGAAPVLESEPIAKAEQSIPNADTPAEPQTAPSPLTSNPPTEAAPAAAPAAAAVVSETPAATVAEEDTGAKKELRQENGEQEKPAVSQPEYLVRNPALSQFFERLPAVLANTGYSEMWGVTLKEDTRDIPTVNVLIKFLRANEGNVKMAEDQLTKALQWRKSMSPHALVDRTYSARKFDGLGYVTTYAESKTVVTWNIYGAVKNIDETFGDIDE